MKHLILSAFIAVAFASCDKSKQECPGSTEKTFAVTGFNRIKAGDAHHITITKGNDFSIKASGCTSDLDDLELTLQPNNMLDIHYKRHKDHRYRVDFVITMPALYTIALSGASKGTVSGFGGQNSVIGTVLSGASECIMDGTGLNAQLHVSGASKLTLKGNTTSLYGVISGASEVRAYEVEATEVDIDVSGASKAYVRPVNSIFAAASGASKVYYKGNPAVKHFETSGNSEIIHE